MREPLEELVLGRGVPVLGICVGMQILARSSEEGRLPGLGWIGGVVRKLNLAEAASRTGLPHMGWNTVASKKADPLLVGLEEEPRFYFLHSYALQCENEDHVLATADYGSSFTCIARRANIYGVQFHPEKSHQNGIQLLKNFGSA
jgi:glutamine amidotransferase